VLLVVAAAALMLGVIAFGLLRGDTFGSIDSSIKFLQASAFAASGFRSTALPYPALALDPGQTFVPFDPPPSSAARPATKACSPALCHPGRARDSPRPGVLRGLDLRRRRKRLAPRGSPSAGLDGPLRSSSPSRRRWGTTPRERRDDRLAASTLAFVLATREVRSIFPAAS
jgi:hypothetical protein